MFRILLTRGLDDLGNAPTSAHPLINDSDRKARQRRKTLNGVILALIAVAAIALVAVLSRPVGPSAIFRGIPPVVVDSVDRGSREWGVSHVRVEGFERLLPPVADGDPASAVVFEARNIGVVTSIPHSSPDAIDRALTLPMRRPGLRNERALHASTASNDVEMSSGNFLLNATIAAYQELRTTMNCRAVRNYKQKIVAATNEILLLHGYIIAVNLGGSRDS